MSTTADNQNIQNRVNELERQLAEAQATIRDLTSLSGNSVLRRMELLFAHSRDIILFIQRNNGHILDANAAAVRGYGYSHAELLALTIHDLRAPDTQGQTAGQMGLADAEGILFETAHRRKDGSTFPVEVSSQGATVGGKRILISVIRDITQRKLGEEERERLLAQIRQEKGEAERQAEELNAMIDALYDPVMVYDRDGVIYRANASAVRAHGFDPSHLHRHETNRTLVVRHPDGRIALPNELPSARALQGETVIGEPLEITNEQGQDLTVLVTSTPLIVNGVQVGAVSVWHDITERKQVEQALREARDRAAWLARLPDENPNPVARVSADGIVLYHNWAAAELPGWTCAIDQPLMKPLLPLVEQAMAQGQEVQQDVQLLDKFYSVSIMPLTSENYANIYGRDITGRKRAEALLKERNEALRTSEARYRRLIENANEGIWTIDADHRTDFINERGAQILGYTIEEMLGKPPLEFVFPEDIAYSSQQLADRKQGINTVHDMRMRHKDGHAIWVSSSSTPIYGEKGEYHGALAMFVDITKRKRAEEALRESEEMRRLALTAGRAGAWSWDLSTDTLQWSDEYYRIFGFEPGSIQPSAKAGFSRVHPDDLPRIEVVVREAIEGGMQIDEVHRVIWPDGSIHWVRGISRAFYNEQGQPYRMAGLAIDITEQKQAEIELQAAHRRTAEILESISDAFYSLDPEGRFTYVNQKAASLWGKQPVDLLGKNIWEVFPSGKETESYQKIQQAFAERRPIQYESYSAFLDQWVDIHLYPTEQGISVYFQDITQRKRAEEALAESAKKLERSNRELEQFAFVASHDLQEPLRKIEAFGDALIKSATDLNDRQRSYIERMQNAAGRMRNMVNGLLQLSRVTTKGQPFVPVDLSRIAADVLSDLEHQIRRTGGRVEVGELPEVEGDPLQLHRLLQNLIGNALKFHRPGVPPVVRVWSESATGEQRSATEEENLVAGRQSLVAILVEDNGIGFNPEEVEQLFRPFQRLVGRSEYEGSGMGLAICRRIVERHGGEITARGEPGKGSTFVITLPLRGGIP